jgi:hypothetical protein
MHIRVTILSLALPDTERVGDRPTPAEAVIRPWYEEANRRSDTEFDTRVSVGPEDHRPTLEKCPLSRQPMLSFPSRRTKDRDLAPATLMGTLAARLGEVLDETDEEKSGEPSCRVMHAPKYHKPR